jgi:hypothetical protein
MMNRLSTFPHDTCPRIAPRRESIAHQSEARKRKRVQFALSEDGTNPVVQVYSYPPVPKELFPTVYWSARDFECMRSARKRLANKKSKTTPKLIESIRLLHRLETNQDFETQIETEAAKLMIAKSHCRGLEKWIGNFMCSHRQYAVRKLIAIQKRCHQENHPEHVEFLMSVWSTRLGAASNRFARNLAKVDEKEAYNETSLKDSFYIRTPSPATMMEKVIAFAA